MTRTTIRVLCVAGRQLVREGLARIIESEPDLDVVAQVAAGEDAVSRARMMRPDVVLLDLHVRGMPGPIAVREIRRHDAKARIIVIASCPDDEQAYLALDAGAKACLVIDSAPQEVIRAIREVYFGRHFTCADLRYQRGTRSLGLTPRQIEVLELISEGLRTREISNRLQISECTVRVHVKGLLNKLQAHGRTQALSEAVRRGLVQLRG